MPDQRLFACGQEDLLRARHAQCDTFRLVPDVFFPALDFNLLDHQHRFREGFTVELHGSGDFADEEHFEGWEERMDKHRALHIWGNSAHGNPDIPESVRIARRIDYLNEKFRDRFAVRISGREGDMGSTIIGVTITRERAREKFVCPAPKVSCAECAFCIDSTDPLVRLLHGTKV
jgi:hypothetical protein